MYLILGTPIENESACGNTFHNVDVLKIMDIVLNLGLLQTFCGLGTLYLVDGCVVSAAFMSLLAFGGHFNYGFENSYS